MLQMNAINAINLTDITTTKLGVETDQLCVNYRFFGKKKCVTARDNRQVS